MQTRRTSGEIQELVEARVALENAQRIAIKAEAKWSAKLKRIDTAFPRDVVIQAICIAWWDYFGSRRADVAWTDLDKYRAMWHSGMNPNAAEVANCLEAIGYDAASAAKRCAQYAGRDN